MDLDLAPEDQKFRDAQRCSTARNGDRLGAVVPGYHADIVAVEGVPVADINAVINSVRWVMKAGSIVVDKTTSDE